MAKEKGKFNPNLGGAFSNPAFGDDAILLNITTENLDVLMKNVQVGSAILFRFNKVTSKGNKHYFVEILPPMKPRENKPAARANSNSDLD
jgi:hypothetical protein